MKWIHCVNEFLSFDKDFRAKAIIHIFGPIYRSLKFTLMQEKIIILDFGSQYTQLIGRRVRELNVYCEIHPFNHFPKIDASVKGVILSGSPYSVRDENGPRIDLSEIKAKFPLLGVCYGAQYLAHFTVAKWLHPIRGSTDVPTSKLSIKKVPCCRESAKTRRCGCRMAIPL